MKILIAYDGTHGADAALDDLTRAGLPADADAMVLAVADASMALASRAFAMAATGMTLASSDHRLEQAAAAVEHAREIASDGVARLRTRFPGWRVSPDAWGGSAASSIVLKADAWKPDLVVLGSRGRARASRAFLGSVARMVVAEARCSVRVGRPRPASADEAPRILVGHDGGASGQSALLAAARRSWPAGAQIRVLAVQDPAPYDGNGVEFGSSMTWRPPRPPVGRGVLREILDQDVDRARRDGLAVSAEIASGVAAGVLVRTARRWKADCVFVGATSRSKAERFLLGSVSSAVADRAPCSVEVVRASLAPR